MLSVTGHVLYLHDKTVHLYSYEGEIATESLALNHLLFDLQGQNFVAGTWRPRFHSQRWRVVKRTEKQCF